MLNSKITAVAAAVALTLGSSVYAGTMGPVCTPGNVTVPCERPAWDFGAQALYLESATTGDYAYYATSTTGAAPVVTNYLDTDPNWGWGFKLEGSYHFYTGNDWNLNWYHYSKDTTNTIAGGVFTFGGLAAATTGSFSYEPRWDAVNLEFGQHVDFGDMEDIRFHGGVQYARVRTNTSASGFLTTTPTTTAALSNSATFNGFGPRFGADMAYNFGNGLAVYGNAATALLIGSGKFSSLATTTIAGVPASTDNYGSTTQFVPEFEGKLGAAYTYAMPQGDLSLDLGWMWVQYFNAQPNVVTYTGGASDFALTGPYVGLKWMGNV